MALLDETALESRDIFTTGQTARLCGVAARTVAKWIDRGLLPAWRIPGSQDRRVSRRDLAKFARQHGMAAVSDALSVRVLAVGLDLAAADRLRSICTEDRGFAVECAETPFQAGLLFYETRPRVVLLDGAMGRLECGSIAAAVRACGRPVGLVGIGTDLGDGGGGTTIARSFLATQPVEVVAELIRTAAGAVSAAESEPQRKAV